MVITVVVMAIALVFSNFTAYTEEIVSLFVPSLVKIKEPRMVKLALVLPILLVHLPFVVTRSVNKLQYAFDSSYERLLWAVVAEEPS